MHIYTYCRIAPYITQSWKDHVVRDKWNQRDVTSNQFLQRIYNITHMKIRDQLQNTNIVVCCHVLKRINSTLTTFMDNQYLKSQRQSCYLPLPIVGCGDSIPCMACIYTTQERCEPLKTKLIGHMERALASSAASNYVAGEQTQKGQSTRRVQGKYSAIALTCWSSFYGTMAVTDL